MSLPALRLTLLVIAVVLGGCANTFSPPLRTDLDFAASRALKGQSELSYGFVDPDRGSHQLAFRHAVSDADELEVTVLGHKIPGNKYSFLLGGGGYRRRLTEADAPLQATIGFGGGGGIGGHDVDWMPQPKRYPGIVVGYADFGLAWRPFRFLSVFGGGRLQRSHGITGDHRPPPTDWSHVGSGVRVENAIAYLALSVGWYSYVNRDDDDAAGTLGMTVGLKLP